MRRLILELESPIDKEYSESPLESALTMEMEGISELDKEKELTTKIDKQLNVSSGLQFEDVLEEIL